MRNLFVAFILVITLCGIAFAQAKPIGELRQMFDYEQSLPLDVKEVGVEDRNGVRIHDISYASPKSGRVTAYLVVPSAEQTRLVTTRALLLEVGNALSKKRYRKAAVELLEALEQDPQAEIVPLTYLDGKPYNP